MRPADPALRALSDEELVARRDALAKRHGRERSRLAFLRSIAKRYKDAEPPPEVDVAGFAAEAMRIEAFAMLPADKLWELAGWRRELAAINESIAKLEAAPQGPDRSQRLERLQADAKVTAVRISEREASHWVYSSSVFNQARRLLEVVADEHLREAKRREWAAMKRVQGDIDDCKERLQSVTQQLAIVRREIRGRMRLVKVEAFLARKGLA